MSLVVSLGFVFRVRYNICTHIEKGNAPHIIDLNLLKRWNSSRLVFTHTLFMEINLSFVLLIYIICIGIFFSF